MTTSFDIALKEAKNQMGINDDFTKSIDDIVWCDAPLPKRFHRCRVQTSGWAMGCYIHRCACGGIKSNLSGGKWIDKNSRKQ